MSVGIARALCKELKAAVAVAAVVSDKVFDTVAPRSAGFPLVTVQSINAEPSRSQDGTSGLEFNRVQVNAYQTTAKLAKDLGDLVVTAIETIRTAVGTAPNNIADVRSILLVDDFQDVIQPTGGSDIPDAYVHRLEFETWHAPA